MARLWLVFLLLGLSAMSAVADGDIVYSARYYLPPGSKGTSHFHLYRINPDGTRRRQITFGRHHDDDPKWSPNGKLISFNRDDKLCVLNLRSGHITTLIAKNYYRYDDPVRWCPDSRHLFVSLIGNVIDVQTKFPRHLAGLSDLIWSPDGTDAVVQKGKDYRIHRQNTPVSSLPNGISRSPVWLDHQTLAALSAHGQQDHYDLQLIGLNGTVQRQFAVEFPKTGPGLEDTPLGIGADDLLTTPERQYLVYAKNHENSYVGTNFQFFLLNLKTEKMHYLTQGQFLAWSPDGQRFCTAPGQDVVDYQKRYDADFPDDYRMVWASPLYIRNANDGPMHQLTPRLSWVTAADWRKARH